MLWNLCLPFTCTAKLRNILLIGPAQVGGAPSRALNWCPTELLVETRFLFSRKNDQPTTVIINRSIDRSWLSPKQLRIRLQQRQRRQHLRKKIRILFPELSRPRTTRVPLFGWNEKNRMNNNNLPNTKAASASIDCFFLAEACCPAAVVIADEKQSVAAAAALVTTNRCRSLLLLRYCMHRAPCPPSRTAVVQQHRPPPTMSVG